MIYIDGKIENIIVFDEKNGKIESIYDYGNENLINNIYLARVSNYNKSLEAYFLEIDKDIKAYLRKKDAKNISINDSLIVQIIKNINGKNPRVTCDISIPGKNIVIIGKKNKFSKKLTREDVNRLKKLNFEGVLFRTSAKFATEEELQEEYEKNTKIYEEISSSKNTLPVPRILYKYDVIDFVLKNHDEKIITNDLDLFKKYKKIYDIEYVGDYELKYSTIYMDYLNLFKEKLELDSGANIIIEYTNALTVVDVNSDKKEDESFKNLAFNTNIEAISEFFRQIKLRNISGIIIMDLINMNEEKDRENILIFAEILNKEYSLDLLIHGFTKLGLLEISRQNTGKRRINAYEIR